MEVASKTASSTAVSLAKAQGRSDRVARWSNERRAGSSDAHHRTLMYALLGWPVGGGQAVNRGSGGGGPPPPLTAAGGGGCETHAAARQVSAPEPAARHLRLGMASQLDCWTGGAAHHSRKVTHTDHSQRAPLPLPLRAFPAARGGRHGPGGGGGGSCLNGGLWRARPERQCCWEHIQLAAMGSVDRLAPIQTFPSDPEAPTPVRGQSGKHEVSCLRAQKGAGARQTGHPGPPPEWIGRAGTCATPHRVGPCVHSGSDMSPCSGGCSSARVGRVEVDRRARRVSRAE